MENYSIKKRTYKILEPCESDFDIDESYIVSLDDKRYILTFVKEDFSYSLSAKARFKNIRKDIKTLTHSNILVPRLVDIDKKNYVYVKEIIEGHSILDEIILRDLDEKIIETIFDYSYYARMFGKMLDFFPSNFIIYPDGKIVYKSYRTRPYDNKNSFEFVDLRYYLYSDELIDYLKKEHLPVDLKRKKITNAVNKETLLLTCKYRR